MPYTLTHHEGRGFVIGDGEGGFYTMYGDVLTFFDEARARAYCEVLNLEEKFGEGDATS